MNDRVRTILVVVAAAVAGAAMAYVTAPDSDTTPVTNSRARSTPESQDTRAQRLAAVRIPASLRPPPPASVVRANPPEPEVANPPPDLRLLGTIIEHPHAQALLRDSSGAIVRISVGDRVDGCLLTGVSKGRVTLTRDGEEFEFDMNQEGG